MKKSKMVWKKTWELRKKKYLITEMIKGELELFISIMIKLIYTYLSEYA